MSFYAPSLELSLDSPSTNTCCLEAIITLVAAFLTVLRWLRRLAAKEAELISRQAELVCQQAAQTLTFAADASISSQVATEPGRTNNMAKQPQVPGQPKDDAAAEAAARAELEQLASQGIEGAKEALDALEAQAEAVVLKPASPGQSGQQASDGPSTQHEDEDTPYVSSDEDDETIRKRISMCPSLAAQNQIPTAYSSSGNLRRQPIARINCCCWP